MQSGRRHCTATTAQRILIRSQNIAMLKDKRSIVIEMLLFPRTEFRVDGRAFLITFKPKKLKPRISCSLEMSMVKVFSTWILKNSVRWRRNFTTKPLPHVTKPTSILKIRKGQRKPLVFTTPLISFQWLCWRKIFWNACCWYNFGFYFSSK